MAGQCIIRTAPPPPTTAATESAGYKTYQVSAMPQETKIINAFALEQLKTHDKVLIA